jgi:hypothetical protein
MVLKMAHNVLAVYFVADFYARHYPPNENLDTQQMPKHQASQQ